jgi:tRNA(Ile)-lysidine synthetase-like protein
MSLLHEFRRHLATLDLAPAPAVVAVSGGPDSVALLDLLVHTRADHGFELLVAHADHGIHPASVRVAEEVRRLALSYGLQFEAGELKLGSSAGETLARTARYAWLNALRRRRGADLLMTAHHADDQIETVLMRILAGSGPAGLAGMASVSGPLVRPLLPFRRAQLVEYVRERGLPVWLDPANADARHLRSWIRTNLLPSLRRRVPRVDLNLERAAAQAARDRAAWDAALDVVPGLDVRRESEGISVAAAGFGDYDSALTHTLLLALARRAGCTLGPTRAARIARLLAAAESGTRVPLGGRWFAELAFGRLCLRQLADEPLLAPQALEGSHGTTVWGRWRFHWEPAAAPERQDRTAMSAWFLPVPLTVRAWVPGEKLRPLGGRGRRLLVRCFQEERVPRSSRESWPVLAASDQIMWIPGVCRSDAALPAGGGEAMRVDAEYA